MKSIPLPAFQDNSLWFLHDGHRALAADPGDAVPAVAALQHHGLQLEAILVKHHNADHTVVAMDRRTKPFLRSREPAVTKASSAWDARTTTDEIGIPGAVRQWKNEFR